MICGDAQALDVAAQLHVLTAARFQAELAQRAQHRRCCGDGLDQLLIGPTSSRHDAQHSRGTEHTFVSDSGTGTAATVALVADDRLYFRQLLSGRDFAREDNVAAQMVNFAYLIGDREKGEVVVVDPAYAVRELVELAEADGMRVTGALATHHHPDHVGGAMMGFTLEGVAELLGMGRGPIHVHRDEEQFVRQVTGASASDLVVHDGGDVVDVGDIRIELLHTPGHTPGSQCFLVGHRLVSGDTLFLEGCGRTDFPGSDSGQMYDSLQRLASLPADVVVFPGHRYSLASSATLDAIKEMNYVYKPSTKEQWLSMFGS
jgi:hydroxyacylglutathione hydrolase